MQIGSFLLSFKTKTDRKVGFCSCLGVGLCCLRLDDDLAAVSAAISADSVAEIILAAARALGHAGGIQLPDV